MQRQITEHGSGKEGKESVRAMYAVFGTLDLSGLAECMRLCSIHSKHLYLLSFKHAPGVVLRFLHKLYHLALVTVL